MKEAISLTESKRLIELESVIERGQKTFLEVGDALTEIRDSRIYRSDYGTFDEYCKIKWGWQRQRAYELISAALTVNELPAKCNQLITREGQARALAAVPAEKRVEVVEKAAAAGPVTAKSITEAAKEVVAKPVATKPKPPVVVEAVVVVRDCQDRVVPPSLLPTWARTDEIQEHLKALSKLRVLVRKAHEANDPQFRHVSYATTVEALDTAYAQFKCALPYAVCPVCQGLKPDKCTQCKGAGFVSEFVWKMTVDPIIKKIYAAEAANRKAAK